MSLFANLFASRRTTSSDAARTLAHIGAEQRRRRAELTSQAERERMIARTAQLCAEQGRQLPEVFR